MLADVGGDGRAGGADQPGLDDARGVGRAVAADEGAADLGEPLHAARVDHHLVEALPVGIRVEEDLHAVVFPDVAPILGHPRVDPLH